MARLGQTVRLSESLMGSLQTVELAQAPSKLMQAHVVVS